MEEGKPLFSEQEVIEQLSKELRSFEASTRGDLAKRRLVRRQLESIALLLEADMSYREEFGLAFDDEEEEEQEAEEILDLRKVYEKRRREKEEGAEMVRFAQDSLRALDRLSLADIEVPEAMEKEEEEKRGEGPPRTAPSLLPDAPLASKKYYDHGSTTLKKPSQEYFAHMNISESKEEESSKATPKGEDEQDFT